jgi:hypothetical protein
MSDHLWREHRRRLIQKARVTTDGSAAVCSSGIFRPFTPTPTLPRQSLTRERPQVLDGEMATAPPRRARPRQSRLPGPRAALHRPRNDRCCPWCCPRLAKAPICSLLLVQPGELQESPRIREPFRFPSRRQDRTGGSAVAAYARTRRRSRVRASADAPPRAAPSRTSARRTAPRRPGYDR